MSLGNFQTSKLPNFKLIILFLLIFCFNTIISAQPAKKSVLSIDHFTNSEDWPVSIFPSEDCIHVYYAGWTKHEGIDDCNNSVELVSPIIGKFNTLTNNNVWIHTYEVLKSNKDGGYNSIVEIGNYVFAIGSQTGCQETNPASGSIILKADKITGIAVSGYPQWNPQGNGHNFNPIFENGQVIGMAGFGSKNGTASLCITDQNGNINPNFGTNGYFSSSTPNSKAYRLIKIENHSTIGYAYTGYKTIPDPLGQHDDGADILIGFLDATGKAIPNVDELILSEGDISEYVDIMDDDAPVCPLKEYPGIFESHSGDWGWDMEQDGNFVYLSCVFDGIWRSGGFCNGKSDYHYEDVGILKLDLGTREIVDGINVGVNEAPDYYPDLEIKNGEIFILGAKSTQLDPLIVEGKLSIFNTNLELQSERTFGDDAWNINCSFDIDFNCNDEIIISGDNNANDEDYYFYTFSNVCQNKQAFNGDDIVNGTPITGIVNWNTDRKVKATVTVTSGSTLNINNCIVQFGASWEMVDFDKLAQNDPSFKLIPKIVVENGGTLNLNGCTLKGLTACNREWMWDGVELRNGGIINSNGATIKDAKIGILVDRGSYNIFGRINPTESDGGGTVMMTGSTVLNCRRGMHFAPTQNNASTILGSNFICDDFLKDPSYRQCYDIYPFPTCQVIGMGTNQFVSANQAKGMTFSGTNWSNSIAIPHELKGIGINSFGSIYTVKSNSTMTGLSIGIQAYGGSDPKASISVLDNNIFTDNIVGIHFNSGEGHSIRNGNQFNLSGYMNQYLIFPHSIGVANIASMKNVYEKDNVFIQTNYVPEHFHSYGILSESTASSSFHQKNIFSNLSAGEQIQGNNTGLKMFCNKHMIRDNAWKVYGLLGDQGSCAGSDAVKPSEKFEVLCDPMAYNNHIDNKNALNMFKYVQKGDQNPPICNQNVIIDNCENGNPTDGCDFVIPKITGGNVDGFVTQVGNLGDGPQKTAIIDQLIQYYFSTNNFAAADGLLAVQTEAHYKRTRALFQLNYGSIQQADMIVSSLPVSDAETQDFITYYNVVKSAKQAETALWELSEASRISLLSIAENRTQGGYAAQAILSFYYGEEYPLIIETDENTASQNNQLKKIEHENTIQTTQMIVLEDRIQIDLENKYVDQNLVLDIINFDRKLIKSLDLLQGKKQYEFSISTLNPGNYIAILKDNQKLVSKSIILKK